MAKNYIITFSGNKIKFTDGGSVILHNLVLDDIAISLGRNCRFNGHTKIFWSVLDHSLLVYRLILGAGYNTVYLLHALLHDAHEIVISDIPKPVKDVIGGNVQMFANSFDKEIIRLWKLPKITVDVKKVIKKYDVLSVAAEARLFMHENIYEAYPEHEMRVEHEIAEVLKHGGESYNPRSPGVVEYKRVLNKVLKTFDLHIK